MSHPWRRPPHVPSTAAPLALLVATTAIACNPSDPRAVGRDPTPSADASVAPALTPRVEIVPAPATGDVAELVRAERARAQAKGRTLLVYVGAKWCEPCRRFHDAALRGEVDPAMPALALLEFDLDRDAERLEIAGYRSKYIPLFARPADDGRASGKQIQGSIKGPGAVDEITPRLKGLLGE